MVCLATSPVTSRLSKKANRLERALYAGWVVVHNTGVAGPLWSALIPADLESAVYSVDGERTYS
ncbi:hypothetical protein BH23CHL1_BH23CHL1_12970 [soil metagenome]